MAEGREYISRPDEMGQINISEEVLATIAAAAAMEVEGVSSLAAGFGSDMASSRKGLSKAVHLSVDEDKVTVEVALLVSYGYAVPTVARAVQEAVISAVENTSGLNVGCVNVSVIGVTFHKKSVRCDDAGRRVRPASFCAKNQERKSEKYMVKGVSFFPGSVYNIQEYA